MYNCKRHQGEQGLPGEKGDKGEPGENGEDGKDGSNWLTGNGVPESTLGKEGDMYLNISNGDIYQKNKDGWSLKMNIKGEDGEDGKDGVDGSNGSTGSKGDTAYSTTILPSIGGYVIVDKGTSFIGDNVIFKIIPNEGYRLKSFSIDGNKTNIKDKVTYIKETNTYTCSTKMIKNGFVVFAEFELDEEPEEVIKDGLLQNIASGAGYSAISRGYFEDENIEVEPYIGDQGPEIVNLLIKGDIQVSLISAGTARNYFVDNPKIKMVAIDNLHDDERLLANPNGKGKDLTLKSSLEEIGEALKGAEIALDQTTTPGLFFSTLLDAINTIMPEGKDVWYTSSTGSKLPIGLPSYNTDCEVHVLQADNANLPSIASECDFVIAVAPEATSLESTMNVVCKYSSVLKEEHHPATWGVNADWLETHEETFEKFMRALVRGMNFKRDHEDECIKDVQKISGIIEENLTMADIALWLGDKEQIDLYDSNYVYTYAESLFEQAKEFGSQVNPNIDVSECIDYSYIINASKELLGQN